MTESSRSGGLKAAFWLTIVIVVGWIVCFWPARLLRGQSGVWWMSLAATAALVPGWIVVFLSGLAILRNDMLAMLVQTLVRLFAFAATAIIVRIVRPDLGIVDFFGWLIGFYLLALTFEAWLLKRRAASAGRV